VTVRFKRSAEEALLAKCQKFKRVFVCNDNEDSGAGNAGALATVRRLAEGGIFAYVIELPVPLGQSKIDLCEYLRDNKVEDFRELMGTADHAVVAVAKTIGTTLHEIERIKESREVLGWIARMDKAEQAYHLRATAKILGVGVVVLREMFKAIEQGQRGKEIATRQTESPQEQWQEDLIWRFDKDGNRLLKCVPINAVKILTHDPRWVGTLAFDEFKHRPVFLKVPPYGNDYADTEFSTGQVLTDMDFLRIGYWLSEEWDLNLETGKVSGAAYTVAHKNAFHPIREYMEGLQWDGAPRLNRWLIDYMGARAETPGEEEYLEMIGRLWAISAVARIFSPGCKADNVLILEGRQGIKKSTALEVLAGAWFTDTPLDLGNKDAYMAIQGAWIVEMAELDALMRAESSSAKAFFTSRSDKYRPPYGREMVQIERQCVFAGTVNHNDYLKDRTGGRRYWPVLCTTINLEALRRDRDQIWAEALTLYLEGARWWPEGDAQRDLCEKEQSLRQMDDPWEDAISEWLEDRDEATVVGILEFAIKMEVEKMTRRHETRVGQIMVRMGWLRKRKWLDGKLTTVYQKPQPVSDDPPN